MQRQTLCRYVDQFKTLIELAVPLSRAVNDHLFDLTGLRLTDDTGPPLKAHELGMHDPMWRDVPVSSIATRQGTDMPKRLEALMQRAKEKALKWVQPGEPAEAAEATAVVPMAGIIAAVCSHAVDDAVAQERMSLPDVRNSLLFIQSLLCKHDGLQPPSSVKNTS